MGASASARGSGGPGSSTGVDDGRGEGGRGEGAGLEICRTLAARVGGTICALSQPGRGSRFELSWPAALTPQQRVACQFAPETLIDETEYAEMAPYIDITTDASGTPYSISTNLTHQHRKNLTFHVLWMD